MGRYSELDYQVKIKINVSLESDSLKWIDTQVKTKKFASRSHLIQYAVTIQKNENG